MTVREPVIIVWVGGLTLALTSIVVSAGIDLATDHHFARAMDAVAETPPVPDAMSAAPAGEGMR